MNCYYHPDREAIATCTTCGRATCQTCSVDVGGKLSCQNCLSTGAVSASQYKSAPPSKPTNPLAIASLVLSVLGLCGPFLFSIAGIVAGHVALKQIAENPEQGGEGLAKAGRLIGIIVTVIYALLLICYLIFFVGLAATGSFS